MQFPVPQFTDVEDKIIGSLTIRQFGILFGSGIIVVLSYTATKNILVVLLAFMVIGFPGIVFAFGPYNGRKLYNTFPFMLRFIFAPKLYVFRKEGMDAHAEAQVDAAPIKKESKLANLEDASTRLKKLNYLLEQKAREEEDLLKH